MDDNWNDERKLFSISFICKGSWGGWVCVCVCVWVWGGGGGGEGEALIGQIIHLPCEWVLATLKPQPAREAQMSKWLSVEQPERGGEQSMWKSRGQKKRIVNGHVPVRTLKDTGASCAIVMMHCAIIRMRGEGSCSTCCSTELQEGWLCHFWVSVNVT